MSGGVLVGVGLTAVVMVCGCGCGMMGVGGGCLPCVGWGGLGLWSRGSGACRFLSRVVLGQGGVPTGSLAG